MFVCWLLDSYVFIFLSLANIFFISYLFIDFTLPSPQEYVIGKRKRVAVNEGC